MANESADAAKTLLGLRQTEEGAGNVSDRTVQMENERAYLPSFGMTQHQDSEHVWGNMEGRQGATNPQPMDTSATEMNQKYQDLPTTAEQPQSSIDISQLLIMMNNLMAQNTAILQRSSNHVQPTQHFSVLPDLTHNIPKFDGLSSAASAKLWLHQLESTAILHRWTEAIAFETARSHLEKAAKNWYLAYIHEIKDWQSFRKAFSNTFLVDKSLTDKFQEMQQRCQGPNENTAEYYFSKLRLCKALNFGLDETKKQIAIELWSRELSTAIMSRSHFDLDDLLKSILELESIENARRQRITAIRRDQGKSNGEYRNVKNQRSATAMTTFRSKAAQRGEYVNKVPSEVRANDSLECFRCKKAGHIAI